MLDATRVKLITRKNELTKTLSQIQEELKTTFDYKGHFMLNIKIADLCSRLDEIEGLLK